MVRYGAQKQLGMVPFSTMAKLRFQYSSYHAIAAGYANETIMQIRMNSPWDPNVAAVANENCTGFSNYAALYNKYLVKSCKIEVWFNPTYSNSTAQEDCMLCFIQALQDGAAAAFTPDALVEGNASVWTIVQGGSQGPHGKDNSHYLKMYRTMRYMNGGAPLNERWDAVTNTNPEIGIYAHIGMARYDTPTVSQTNTMPKVAVLLRVTYYTKFYAPKNISEA